MNCVPTFVRLLIEPLGQRRNDPPLVSIAAEDGRVFCAGQAVSKKANRATAGPGVGQVPGGNGDQRVILVIDNRQNKRLTDRRCTVIRRDIMSPPGTQPLVRHERARSRELIPGRLDVVQFGLCC